MYYEFLFGDASPVVFEYHTNKYLGNQNKAVYIYKTFFLIHKPFSHIYFNVYHRLYKLFIIFQFFSCFIT